MITMLQNKINKILINYLLLMSASIVSVMSQQNEYESFIEKGNNSFEENSVDYSYQAIKCFVTSPSNNPLQGFTKIWICFPY